MTSSPSSCLTCWGAKSHSTANLARLLQKGQRSKEMKQEEEAYKHSSRNICKGELTSTAIENKCSLQDFKASRVLHRKAK